MLQEADFTDVIINSYMICKDYSCGHNVIFLMSRKAHIALYLYTKPLIIHLGELNVQAEKLFFQELV